MFGRTRACGNPPGVSILKEPALTLARLPFYFWLPCSSLFPTYQPAGDQPQAIAKLTEGVLSGAKHQTLVGVTGSGKTFTVANVIRRLDKPTLVISHNKTLAAQLYAEFKSFFPRQRRRVFRQLLRLLPARGLHSAHRHLHREGFQRQRGDRAAAALDDEFACSRGATWSSSPASRASTASAARKITRRSSAGASRACRLSRDQFLCRLVDLQYDAQRHRFRARPIPRARRRGRICARPGPRTALRIEFFGDEIERITRFEPLTGEKTETLAIDRHFPGQAIRHAGDEDQAGHAGHSRGIGRAHRLFREARQIARGPAHQDAHRIRSGNDGGNGFLLRHRKLFAPSCGRPPGSRPGTLARFLSRTITC